MKAGASGSIPTLCQEDARKNWENGWCSCAKMPFSFKKNRRKGEKNSIFLLLKMKVIM